MASKPKSTVKSFLDALQYFAQELTKKFAVKAPFSPEDQLKGPVDALICAAASSLGFGVDLVTEVHAKALAGRPDMGVARSTLLTGYVELKAPGKGADPTKLKGADKVQWEKFKELPNLIYTDGNAWALYRNGERVGKIVHLSGDATADGLAAAVAGDDAALLDLLRSFFFWEPIVPTNPRALAEMLAPICRLLRWEVRDALKDSDSSLSSLATDWRKYLFPDADDQQFADAYAQTLTYALLLARLTDGSVFTADEAVKAIRKEHRLLAESLKILADDKAREEIEVPVALLERVIGAVDVAALSKKSKGDPWLYFYEDFLAAYDPKMRKDRGVYYTPVPVVQTQVKLVAQLLREKFGADCSFVDEKVVTLDPATGTGTYIIAALNHGLKEIEAAKGKGMRANAATTGAMNIHAFELLVGPYAVAHLRLTQQIVAEGGTPPADGMHVYLTDTLEPPHAAPPGHLPLAYKSLGEEHKRAQKVKATTPVLVCIGNPPYDRQTRDDEDVKNKVARKGGWIRYGDSNKEGDGILQDFIRPLAALGAGVHAKNLYNDYVYFWRWALWKVFERGQGPGIVSFITASSYLAGPGFAGMRRMMRETFDELWIIDLEGDNLGARKTENVFAIQTPVAIAIGARYDAPKPDNPAKVRYTKITGTQEAKFIRLDTIEKFADLKWKPCPSDWTAPFLPLTDNPYFDWPLLTDLFPQQENGIKLGRTWPVAPSKKTLNDRWTSLLAVKDRRELFKDSPTGKKVDRTSPKLLPLTGDAPPIASLGSTTPIPVIFPFAYRSFDRYWIIADGRVIDRPSPNLWSALSNKQVYITSLLTAVIGEGPAAVATPFIPDLHHFCNRGAKDVIPLWRDPHAKHANITAGVLSLLAKTYGKTVAPEDLFAYTYAVLASPAYVETFWDELVIPGPRLPVTKEAKLFFDGVGHGKHLIWLHTFGERCVPKGEKPGRVPPGKARCAVGTPGDAANYPNAFSYDEAKGELHIGEGAKGGIFKDVPKAVWDFSISGFQPLQSWLGYRMKDRSGRKSSPLDDIRPERWEFDAELLNVIWILEHTVAAFPALAAWLKQVVAGSIFPNSDFPKPLAEERERLVEIKPGLNGKLF